MNADFTEMNRYIGFKEDYPTWIRLFYFAMSRSMSTGCQNTVELISCEFFKSSPNDFYIQDQLSLDLVEILKYLRNFAKIFDLNGPQRQI